MSPPPDGSSAVLDPATLGKLQDALAELVRTERIEVAFAAPVLLCAPWLEQLRQAHPPQEALPMLDRLQAFGASLKGEPLPFGTGPIDALFARVHKGEITSKQALALASGADIGWRLSANYVARMAASAERWAQDGKWREGVMLGQLVLAAVDARRARIGFEQDTMEFAATLHWLDIVTRALCDVPDPRLFQDALARGEKLAGVIEDPAGVEEPAAMLHALGVLHLDPYTGGRSSDGYRLQHSLWLDRFRIALEAEGTGWDQNKPGLPEPAEAMRKAAEYLERAAGYRSGVALARTRKAQVQALVWGRFLGLAPEPAEVERVGRDALRVLDTPQLLGLRTEVQDMLDWYRRLQGTATGGDAVEPEVLKEVELLLATPVDLSLQGSAAEDVLGRYMQFAVAVQEHSAPRAFELWSRVQALARQRNPEARSQFFMQGLSLLAGAFAPAALDPAPQALQAEFEDLRSRAEADEFTRAAKLLALALESIERNQEEQALPILQAAAGASEAFARTYPELLRHARATLLVGAGVNRYNAQEFERAAALYVESAGAWLDCDNPARAMQVVERVVDIARHGARKALHWFIAGMKVIAPRLEDTYPGAAERLQRLYREVLALIVSTGEVKLILMILFLEMAKGAAFAQALLQGGPREWLASEEARKLEERIAAATRACAGQPGLEPTKLDREWVLTSYVSRQEQAGGATAAERLRNLCIAMEDALATAQRSQAPRPQWITGEHTVQEALGEKSALLCVYVGQLPSGEAAVFQLLLTREDFFFAMGKAAGLNTSLIRMQDGDHQIALSPFAFSVASLLQAIQQDPLTRNVAAAAATQLQLEEHNLLGGDTRQKLDELRAAGKEHLYVWPHGPYHFAPFHLLGPEDAPLADAWNVTYLPSLNLLDPARRRAATPRAEFIAIGLDFPAGNARGLPPLVDAEAEALDVTRVMEAPRALTGAALTKQAVLEAFQGHRRLHVATHGDLPVSTPGFQALYLSVEPEGDVLHAYEILRLDLKGVDLVTLSACETALGRFDIGDNLRGFPASLLTAGVSTIIGTLWPVETTCARYFFVRLHASLHAGASKGDAFRRAQVQTRRKYPQYRDWGAFYLTGAIA